MRPISTPATLPEMTAKKISAVAEDDQHQQGQADENRRGGQIGDRQRALQCHAPQSRKPKMPTSEAASPTTAISRAAPSA